MRSAEFFAGGPLPKHDPNANATNTTLVAMDSLPRTDRDILCALVGRTARVPTAVPRVGAGACLEWHINVQSASPRSTGHTLVNVQWHRLHEASGLGPVMTAQMGKAKVAAVLTICARGGHGRPDAQPRARARHWRRVSGQPSFRGGPEWRKCFRKYRHVPVSWICRITVQVGSCAVHGAAGTLFGPN